MTKSKRVVKSSIFTADQNIVMDKLKELKTLQFIAAPLASFSALDGSEDLIWQQGQKISFKLKVFGFLPLGTHTIEVIEFDEDRGYIRTHENNPHVPVWNHTILLEAMGPNKVRYTDDVEIQAGWKTAFVYAWSVCFYAHRQRKWRRLLADC